MALTDEKFIPVAMTNGQPELSNCGVNVMNERGTDIFCIRFLDDNANTKYELLMDTETAKALRTALNCMKVLA